MSRRTNSDSQPNHLATVRVYRLDDGTTVYCRVLTPIVDRIMGFWTRRERGSSWYCPPELTQAAKEQPWQWKGYLAAERYWQPDNVWIPVALEITEHAELDMRGLVARGQVWAFTKGPKIPKRHQPLYAKLHERVDPTTLPQPHPILPAIRSTYADQRIELYMGSPCPDRVKAVVSKGAPPSGTPAARDDHPLTREEMEAARQRLAGQGFRIGDSLGSPSRNGTSE